MHFGFDRCILLRGRLTMTAQAARVFRIDVHSGLFFAYRGFAFRLVRIHADPIGCGSALRMLDQSGIIIAGAR
jgi:hypothetical protein